MVRPRLSLVAPLALVMLGGLSVPAATAAPGDDPPVVETSIDSFTPAAPEPGQDVTIAGTVTNTSSVILEKPQAVACVARKRLTKKAEIAALPTEVEQHPSLYRTCEGLGNTPAFQEFDEPLQPGSTARFTVRIRWQDWEISRQNGAYVVGILVRAEPEGKSRVTVGRSRTLMPVITPGKNVKTVRTAMVLPLQHRPTQFGGETFADESLGEALLPTGRLGRLLTLGASSRPVTWLIDPGMLDEIRRMADGGYQVLTPENRRRQGQYAAVAANWLAKLNSTRAKNPIILLPYGDPDAESLVATGSPKILARARELSAQETRRPNEPASSGLWLEQGSANAKTLVAGTTGYLDRALQEVTLVSNWAWPPADRPATGPIPLVDVTTPAGPVRAVVTDAALTAGGPDPATATVPVQLRQRFASETALLALSGTATVVAVPPRGFDPDGTSTAVMHEALGLPWVRPALVDSTITRGQARPARSPGVGRTGSGLSDSHWRQLRELDRAIAAYNALVTDPERAGIPSLRRGMTRSASYAWRGSTPQAQRFLSFQNGLVTGQLRQVHIVNGNNGNGDTKPTSVTLSGSKGQFPLTIANDLNQPVKVGLTVEPVNRSDLKIEPFQTVRLGPRQKATFQVKASAEANGLIRAQAQVISPDGHPVGPPKELLIEAAQYGSVGWFLVGGAVALLFGTSFVRIYRRIHTERRTTEEHRTPATAGT